MTERRVSFTGRSRRHQNRWKVRAADIAARWIISIGGVATIVAVLLVLAFLVSVVLPLFWPPARLAPAQGTPVAVAGRPQALGLDEYQLLCWSIDESGELCVFRPDTGDVVSRRPLVDHGQITAISASATGSDIVLGMADGSIRVGSIATLSEFQSSDELPAEWRALAPGEVLQQESGIVQRTPQGQWRIQRVEVEFGPAWSIADRPIERLDHLSPAIEGSGSKGPTILAWAGSRPHLITTKRNELTGVLRRDTEHVLPVPNGWAEPPFKVLLTSQADNVLLVSQSGQVARIETRDPDQAQVVEQVPLVEQGRRLTLCQWVLGRETLLCGDDQGKLRAWFRVPMTEGGGLDGQTLSAIHELPVSATTPSAVVAGDISQRSRLVAVGFADGRIAVYHVTAERLVAESQVPADEPIRAIEFAPKEDGLVVWAGPHVWRFEFDPRYAEITASTLFGAVWYEGRSEPAHIWQSSFAGVDSEPKLGLWPLVFGTLKATLYSMLFGAPIALLAAVYASEFMSPKLRAKVKPAIEIMASLPSVVLGFLAALVLAPVVESQLASLLGIVICTPLALLVGALLWQLLPASVIPYLTPFRLLAIAVAFAAGVLVGILVGPQFEILLFAGSLQRWLDGKVGSAVNGWLILVLPATSVAVAVASGSLVNPWLRKRWGGISRTSFAFINLSKFLVGGMVAVGLAWGVAAVLVAGGIDPRGTVVDTYVQRNALIVGFVMGFAIIPLVFTIADDALATVPQHLRSASLGAGATPWQTAIRIVIPTAMSGLFSAVMIGLGRAVGETMIVLMAGGNTPVMQWNVFNGFRTLSANIAVELPEAVRGSSHYRTLFLAALTLFLLTFVVNTVAELVRIRFRKRAYQL